MSIEEIMHIFFFKFLGEGGLREAENVELTTPLVIMGTFFVLTSLTCIVTVPRDHSDLAHNAADDQHSVRIIRRCRYCNKAHHVGVTTSNNDVINYTVQSFVYNLM